MQLSSYVLDTYDKATKIFVLWQRYIWQHSPKKYKLRHKVTVPNSTQNYSPMLGRGWGWRATLSPETERWRQDPVSLSSFPYSVSLDWVNEKDINSWDYFSMKWDDTCVLLSRVPAVQEGSNKYFYCHCDCYYLQISLMDFCKLPFFFQIKQNIRFEHVKTFITVMDIVTLPLNGIWIIHGGS